MRSHAVTMGALATTLLLAGCGGSTGSDAARGEDPDETTPATTEQSPVLDDETGADADDSMADADAEDSCALLDDDDLAAAFGMPVTGRSSAPGGCVYEVDPDVGGFYQWQTVPPDSYASNRQMAQDNDGLFELVEIDGLGDEAFRRDSLGGDGSTIIGTDLWLLVGDEGLAISSGLLEVETMMTGQQALAELLIEKRG